MADIELIGVKESLESGKQKINDNFTALNNEVSGGATGLQQRVTTLEAQEQDHETRLVSAEETIVDHENRLDNLVAEAGSSNSEIVDSRYDEPDNITYPTLGDRLNAKSEQIGNLSADIVQLQDYLNYMPINGGDFDGNEPIGVVIDGGTY